MNLTTLIQPTAEIVSITTLKKNDVYKRLNELYGNSYDLVFGVVLDVMHNGTDAAITALEFSVDTGNVKPVFKVFGTNADIKIFPAVADEVRMHFSELRAKAAELLKAAQHETEVRFDVLSRVDDIIARADNLTDSATTPFQLIEAGVTEITPA